MKKLPIGIQSIEKILGNNEYAYVDKTGLIKKLIDDGAPHYFMALYPRTPKNGQPPHFPCASDFQSKIITMPSTPLGIYKVLA
jgi:hypothetical protein